MKILTFATNLALGPLLVSCACKPSIKYSGTDLLIEGVSVPGSNGFNTVAKVAVTTKKLLDAGQLVQIMDMHQVAICRSMKQAKSLGIKDPVFYQRMIEQQTNSQIAITQFALASQSGDKAVSNWIDRYEPRAQAIEKEVKKIEGNSVLTTETMASAAASNPEVVTLKSAEAKDEKVATVASIQSIVPAIQ